MKLRVNRPTASVLTVVTAWSALALAGPLKENPLAGWIVLELG